MVFIKGCFRLNRFINNRLWVILIFNIRIRFFSFLTLLSCYRRGIIIICIKIIRLFRYILFVYKIIGEHIRLFWIISKRYIYMVRFRFISSSAINIEWLLFLFLCLLIFLTNSSLSAYFLFGFRKFRWYLSRNLFHRLFKEIYKAYNCRPWGYHNIYKEQNSYNNSRTCCTNKCHHRSTKYRTDKSAPTIINTFYISITHCEKNISFNFSVREKIYSGCKKYSYWYSYKKSKIHTIWNICFSTLICYIYH